MVDGDRQAIHGEVTFRDSSDVTVDFTGDPDTACFVQVMQGRGSDPERARELMAKTRTSGPRSGPTSSAA